MNFPPILGAPSNAAAGATTHAAPGARQDEKASTENARPTLKELRASEPEGGWTKAEVAKHDNPEVSFCQHRQSGLARCVTHRERPVVLSQDCWLIIEGKVYDLTTYVEVCPCAIIHAPLSMHLQLFRFPSTAERWCDSSSTLAPVPGPPRRRGPTTGCWK